MADFLEGVALVVVSAQQQEDLRNVEWVNATDRLL